MYAWVGASFDATPTQLGAITLGRAMMQALSSPLGGVAGWLRGVQSGGFISVSRVARASEAAMHL